MKGKIFKVHCFFFIRILFYKNYEAQNRQKIKKILRTILGLKVFDKNLLRILAKLIFHPPLRIRISDILFLWGSVFFDTESHKKSVLFMRTALLSPVLNFVQSNQNLPTMHAILNLVILIKNHSLKNYWGWFSGEKLIITYEYLRVIIAEPVLFCIVFWSIWIFASFNHTLTIS